MTTMATPIPIPISPAHKPTTFHFSPTSPAFLHHSPRFSNYIHNVNKDNNLTASGHPTPPETPLSPEEHELKNLPYTWAPVPPLPHSYQLSSSPRSSSIPFGNFEQRTLAITSAVPSENMQKFFGKEKDEGGEKTAECGMCTCTLYPLPTPSSRNYEVASREYFDKNIGGVGTSVNPSCEVHSRQGTPKIEDGGERAKGVRNWFNYAEIGVSIDAKGNGGVYYGQGTDSLCRMKREDWKRHRHLGVIYGKSSGQGQGWN